MANKKFSDPSFPLGLSPDGDDILMITHVSTMTTKTITVKELRDILIPDTYTSNMIGNETFISNHLLQKELTCILDAGGSERNFNPSGTFLIGFEVKIINDGDENIIFDSNALAEVIFPEMCRSFIYTGSSWINDPNKMITYSDEQMFIWNANITIDWNEGATAYGILGGTTAAITLAGGVNGKVYRLRLTQDGTGSRLVTWISTIKWRDGSAPILTTTINKSDWITFVYSNGEWYADASTNF